MPNKKGLLTQEGRREMLAAAALNGARVCIQAQVGSVVLENVGSPTGSSSKNSQRFIGGVFIVMGTVAGLVVLSLSRAGAIFPAMFGFLFVLIGYCIIAYRDRFVIQPEADAWTREKGVVPFVKQQKGSLAEIKGLRLSRETRQIQQGESGATSYYDVWAA